MSYYISDKDKSLINKRFSNLLWAGAWPAIRTGTQYLSKYVRSDPRYNFDDLEYIPDPPRNRTSAPPRNDTWAYFPDKQSTAVQQKFRSGFSLTKTEEERKRSSDNNMTGSRLKRTRSVKSGNKKFKVMKLVNSTVNFTTQQLGIANTVSPYAFTSKHLVSEFDPGSGGAIAIGKGVTDQNPKDLPMHVYCLNHYCGGSPDTSVGYPTNGTNQNGNINNRAWHWRSNNKFDDLFNARYYINDPTTTSQDFQPGSKVYRKGICIDFQMYGCRKTYTEYDVRVIKILDPKYCPDYDLSLVDDATTPNNTHLTDFQQAWQSLVYPYTVNPMLKGIEPGPDIPKRWFKTVAKKRISIGEQSGDLEQVTAVKGRIYINCNEVNNMAWDQKGFTVESGATFYDAPPAENVDMNSNAASHTKPHWRSRYYLVIRALCPQDLGATLNEDGLAYAPPPSTRFSAGGHITIDYCPTYDLAVRTTYATINGQV